MLLPSEFINQCAHKPCAGAYIEALAYIAETINQRLSDNICLVVDSPWSSGKNISFTILASLEDHAKARAELAKLDQEVRDAAAK